MESAGNIHGGNIRHEHLIVPGFVCRVPLAKVTVNIYVHCSQLSDYTYNMEDTSQSQSHGCQNDNGSQDI